VEVKQVGIKGKKQDEKGSSFSGDIRQFYDYLTDRVGVKKLDQVRDLIKNYANSETSEDEDKFKLEMDKLLDEKQRTT